MDIHIYCDGNILLNILTTITEVEPGSSSAIAVPQRVHLPSWQQKRAKIISYESAPLLSSCGHHPQPSFDHHAEPSCHRP